MIRNTKSTTKIDRYVRAAGSPERRRLEPMEFNGDRSPGSLSMVASVIGGVAVVVLLAWAFSAFVGWEWVR